MLPKVSHCYDSRESWQNIRKRGNKIGKRIYIYFLVVNIDKYLNTSSHSLGLTLCDTHNDNVTHSDGDIRRRSVGYDKR